MTTRNLASIISDLETANAKGVVLSLEKLRSLVTEASAAHVNSGAADAITLLYTGKMGVAENSPGAYTVTDALAAESPRNVLTLSKGKVDVATLLNEEAFKDALKLYAQKVNPGFWGDEVERILNGSTTPDGTRIDGLWDDASRRFAENAKGDVRVVIGINNNPNSVFIKTELPALLKNPAVTHIEGIPIADIKAVFFNNGGDLRALQSTDSLAAFQTVFRRVQYASELNMAMTGMYAGASSTAKADFLNKVSNIEEFLAKNPAGHKRIQDYLASLPPEARNIRLDYHNYILNSAEGVHITAGGTRKFLSRLGIVGAVLGLSVVSVSAGAAELRGDHEGAKKIVGEFAADTAGSEVGQLVGALLAGAVAGLIGLTVAEAAIPVLIVALIGGYFGGEAGTEFYKLLDDSDADDKRDIINRLNNLLLGQGSSIITPLPADLNGEKYTIDASLSRDEIFARAKTDIAWRYAVRELNPFVITDVSYERHNTDGSLDLFDKDSHPNGLSEQYLSDRAEMLWWKMKFDKKGALDDDDLTTAVRGGHKSYSEDWNTKTITGNWDYIDYVKPLPGNQPLQLSIDGTGVSLSDHQIVFGDSQDNILGGSGDSDHLYGGAGADTLYGGHGDDYLEGNAGNDSLIGSTGKDKLLGGSGDDSLAGGSGDDTLLGGSGNDTYKFDYSFGKDTITDSDGLGSITMDDQVLGQASAIVKVADNVWETQDKKYVLTQADTRLIIGQRTVLGASTVTGTIAINDWKDGATVQQTEHKYYEKYSCLRSRYLDYRPISL
jgi:hypothetical protein